LRTFAIIFGSVCSSLRLVVESCFICPKLCLCASPDRTHSHKKTTTKTSTALELAKGYKAVVQQARPGTTGLAAQPASATTRQLQKQCSKGTRKNLASEYEVELYEKCKQFYCQGKRNGKGLVSGGSAAGEVRLTDCVRAAFNVALTLLQALA
jgi:hypothetical protein